MTNDVLEVPLSAKKADLFYDEGIPFVRFSDLG